MKLSLEAFNEHVFLIKDPLKILWGEKINMPYREKPTQVKKQKT